MVLDVWTPGGFPLCLVELELSLPKPYLEEVVNDPHLHQRGMLRWVDHPVVGRIAAPNSPIRVQGNEPMELTLNPELGQDNDRVYGEWLGLDEDEIASLRAVGAI